MYHGAHTRFALHVGQCFTDSAASAARYAGTRGTIAAVTIDFDGLVVVEVDGYDHDSNTAAGDDGDAQGADVLVYDDADESGRWHRTWRMMTARAVSAVTVDKTVAVDDIESDSVCPTEDDILAALGA
jgi:hypothetical protein